MKAEHVDTWHRSVVAGHSANNGPRGIVDTEGELVSSWRHGGTARETAHFPALQDGDPAYSVRHKARQNSRKLKWRSLLHVALVGGLLVALARAIKCIRQETEAARTLVGSSFRRLAGGDERECEGFGSSESGGNGGGDAGDTSAEGSGRRSSQARLSLPAPGATGSGASAEGRRNGSVEPESFQAAGGAGDPGESSVAEQFSNIFLAHLRLLTSRAHPSSPTGRDAVVFDLVLQTGRTLTRFFARPLEASRLSEAERRFLSAVQAIFEFERDNLSHELLSLGFHVHIAGVRVVLEALSTLFLRDETATALLGRGAETREAGGSTGASDSEEAAASGPVAGAGDGTASFWGNNGRVLRAIEQFIGWLRVLRANEWLLVQGGYTSERAMQTAQLRQELLDSVTVCVSPGTGPLEQRDTFNYLDLYLLGLFGFFLRSEMRLLRVFPDAALEERIVLLLDLVYQLSGDGKVPYPGP